MHICRPTYSSRTRNSCRAGQQKGVQNDLQIGRIDIQPTTSENQDTCTQQVVDCPSVRDSCNKNRIAPKSKQSFWFDGATTTDTLVSSTNIKVLDDLPEGLDSGTSSFARRRALLLWLAFAAPSCCEMPCPVLRRRTHIGHACRHAAQEVACAGLQAHAAGAGQQQVSHAALEFMRRLHAYI